MHKDHASHYEFKQDRPTGSPPGNPSTFIKVRTAVNEILIGFQVRPKRWTTFFDFLQFSFFSQREMLLLVLALWKFSRFLFFLYFLPIWMHFSDALPQIVWYHSTKGVGRVIKTSKILLKCFLDKVVHLLHLHFCGFWFNSEHCPIFHFPPFIRLYVTGVAAFLDNLMV